MQMTIADIATIAMALVAVLGYFLPKVKGTRDIELYLALREDAKTDEEVQEVAKLRERLYKELKRSNSSLGTLGILFLIATLVGLARCVLGLAASLFMLLANGGDASYLDSAFEWLVLSILAVMLAYCIVKYR